MDHLQRFFLELASLRREVPLDLELPDQGVFLEKKAEDAALREAQMLLVLESLWEKAVTVQAAQPQTHAAARHPASVEDAPGARVESLPQFGNLLRREQGQLTAADLSRFFERDARRYGKGE